MPKSRGKRGNPGLLLSFLAFTVVFALGWLFMGQEPGDQNQAKAKAGDAPKPPYGLPPGAELLDKATGRVTGLGGGRSGDEVLLYGRVAPDNAAFYADLYLVLIPGSTGKPMRLTIPGDASSGYGPRLGLYDFTGDGLRDILLVSATGGSGGALGFAAISAPKGVERVILDPAIDYGVGISGRYLNGYKAVVRVVETGREYLLDLSSRKRIYDEVGIYKDGKLLEPVTPFAGPIGSVKPVRRRGLKPVYDLRCIQQVKGTSGADAIAEVSSLKRYDGTSWRLLKAPLTPLDTRLLER